MTSMNDCEMKSSVSAANTAIRVVLAALIALGVVILSPAADAQDNCYTDREAQTCLICLQESEALRELAREKEAERNALAAALNVEMGRLMESRDHARALDLERLEYRDAANENARRPTWWVVVGVGLGALVVGVGGGLVMGL